MHIVNEKLCEGKYGCVNVLLLLVILSLRL